MMLASVWNSIARLLRVMRTPYTRSLEGEVSRLRAENRALLNSILGIAGLPPMRLETKLAREHRRDSLRAGSSPGGNTLPRAGASPRGGTLLRASSNPSTGAGIPAPAVAAKGDSATRVSANAAGTAHISAEQGIVLPVNATRRRSWQQINRILEIEESRRLLNRDNADAMLHAPGAELPPHL
jgi:hypothetical protein